MHGIARILLASAVLALGTACATPAEEDVGTSGSAVRIDPNRAPQIVRVPVRFTRNEPEDVGATFSVSWLPFTSVKKTSIDGFTWGYWTPSVAKNIVSWYVPDSPGAGYATAWFRVEVPYSTEGTLAYELARVKLESELIKSEIAWRNTTSYSPLRVRAGSDQPCLSITMNGSLDGKFRAMSLPYTDQDFTERDWKVGDKDASGRPITKVIVGTLAFTAAGWPDNVEGETNISGGVAAGHAFLMVDKTDGQGQSGYSRVFVNLTENDRGAIAVGATFSTNGGILNDRDKAAFDSATARHRAAFGAEVERGEDAINSAWAAAGNAPLPP